MADIATIARPYAEALFASAKPADLSAWANQLEDLAALFENAELIALANNPKLSSNDLFKFIEGLLQSKPDQGLASFLNFLANRAACALGSTSRRKICSAPLTARPAT